VELLVYFSALFTKQKAFFAGFATVKNLIALESTSRFPLSSLPKETRPIELRIPLFHSITLLHLPKKLFFFAFPSLFYAFSLFGTSKATLPFSPLAKHGAKHWGIFPHFSLAFGTESYLHFSIFQHFRRFLHEILSLLFLSMVFFSQSFLSFLYSEDYFFERHQIHWENINE
jgi:hypothetical protein